MEKYLQPIWDTNAIYDESGIIIGEEGEMRFLFTPLKNSVVVRDIHLEKTYQEGKDYLVTDTGIKRVKDGELPFWNTDEYFSKTYNPPVMLMLDPEKADIAFEEQRYIFHSEGADGVRNYLAVSYQTEEKWQGYVPAQDENAKPFVQALQAQKKAKIMFYGDSITVGCNASGTEYGGNCNPYLQPWYRLVSNYLAETFNAEITVENKAVGGWTVKNGQDAFDERILPHCKDMDLFVLAFGMNDTHTSEENYMQSIQEMMDKYLAENPNGNILLVATMLPNCQCKGWRKNQEIFEGSLLKIQQSYANNNVSVARVTSVIFDMEKTGKPIRDWLANSVNHPTDFCVRIYAQVILQTLLGLYS